VEPCGVYGRGCCTARPSRALRPALIPRHGGLDRLRSSRRTRTRALAPRVWVRRSSVDRRIENAGWRHLHDPPTIDHPAVQSISRRDLAHVAARRVAVLAGQLVRQAVKYRGKVLVTRSAMGSRHGLRSTARGEREAHAMFGTSGSHIQNMKLTEIRKDLMSTIERSTDFDRARGAGNPGLACRNRPAPERVTA